MGEVIEIDTITNNGKYKKDDVLSVSDQYGVVNQIELQGRSFAGDDINNYKVVHEGHIVYTRSPLKEKPYGIIKEVIGISGIVSPLYIVNLPKKGISSKFIHYSFDTSQKTNQYLRPLVRMGAKHTMNVSNEEWLSGNIFITKEIEQEKIGNYFRTLDNLITLHQQKCKLNKLFDVNDWEQRKLGELCKIVGGGTPNTAKDDYWDGDINWYTPAEISDKIYVNSSQRKITKFGFDNSSAKLLPVGTVLFTSRAGIGKTAILSKKACTNQGFQSIVPNEKQLNAYFIFSRTEELKKYGEIVGAGSTFVEVSGKQMAAMPLMMPKLLSEQKKIGSYFRTLDNLITLHRRKLILLKKVFRITLTLIKIIKITLFIAKEITKWLN